MQSRYPVAHYVNRIYSGLSNSSRLSTTNSIENNEQSSYRIWSTLTIKNKRDQSLIKLRVQDLPKKRFEDFVNFKMNYFVKDTIMYKASGVNDNPEAVKECRNYFAAMLSKPTVQTHVYMLDNDKSNNIIGASTLNLTKENDVYEENNNQVTTMEMKRLLNILHHRNSLFNGKDAIKKYGVDRIYEDKGLAIHPEYRLLGVAKHDALMRRMVCKANGVPLTGAWCMEIGTQRACEKDGWDTLFEISYEKLATILGVDFKDPPPSCKYMAVKII